MAARNHLTLLGDKDGISSPTVHQLRRIALGRDDLQGSRRPRSDDPYAATKSAIYRQGNSVPDYRAYYATAGNCATADEPQAC